VTTRIASWLSWPSLIRTVVRRLRLATRLMRDPEISWLLKAIPIVAGLYVVSPLDFIPDPLPLIGEVDDLGILLLALESFVRFSPSRIVAFHQAAIEARRPFSRMPHDGPVIDAEFRREQ
jgi:uncharacterized membrane protein YkvA (DUF1232 family)